MVLFKSSAERAYARFRAGDQFVASGYVHEYEFERDGTTVQREEFVARRIGHDTARTRYNVDRPTPAAERDAGPEAGRESDRTVETPAAIGLRAMASKSSAAEGVQPSLLNAHRHPEFDMWGTLTP